jgi:hypothetical protein
MRSEADPSVSEIRILSSGLAVKEGSASILKFPENREFNREFFGFAPDSALPNAKSGRDFNALQANSLRSAKTGDLIAISMRCRPNSLIPKEQGIFSQEQGIFGREQGISIP